VCGGGKCRVAFEVAGEIRGRVKQTLCGDWDVGDGATMSLADSSNSIIIIIIIIIIVVVVVVVLVIVSISSSRSYYSYILLQHGHT
jgi:heme/copper-type cytochrome/quinol oxidase subunit 2